MKAGEETVTVSLRMTPTQRGKLARLGGAKWMRLMIDQKKDEMRIVRIKDNLYRYSRERWVCMTPKVLEHFNKLPEVRKVLGRWSPCPNINIASVIRSGLLEVINK